MKNYIVKKDDLVFNINTIKDIAGSSKIIAVLKGYGYGLGIVEFASLLLENGIDFFAVSEIEEALVLREAGFSNDILLLTATTLIDELSVALDNDIIVSVGSEECLKNLTSLSKEKNKVARAHLKIDTGFGRFGFIESDIKSAAKEIKTNENISFEGVFTHLSYSFSDNRKDVQIQYDRFLKCIEILIQNGIDIPFKHICNSCAFLKYKDMHLSAVRVGSAFLGRLPLNATYGLKKVGVLSSNVIEMKTFPKGYYVGYANTYKTKKDTKIAIVPVGYKDGFGVEKSKDTFRFNDILRYMLGDLLLFRKKLTVDINGQKVPVIGRVSMYNIVLDVTGTDIKPGDTCLLNANPILVSKDIKRLYI